MVHMRTTILRSLFYVGSAYPGGQQSAPPYIAPPGGGQPYPAGPSGPVRSNSSPHTPYQPVYPGIVHL